MAIFAASPPAYQTTASVGSSATQIYNTTSVTTGGHTYSFPTGVTLSELTIVNTGSVTCFVGTSAVTAATGTPLRSGEQLTIRGSNHVQAESGATSWNLYAITSSGTTSVEAGLATVDATV